jgi:hypothetical protein
MSHSSWSFPADEARLRALSGDEDEGNDIFSPANNVPPATVVSAPARLNRFLVRAALQQPAPARFYIHPQVISYYNAHHRHRWMRTQGRAPGRTTYASFIRTHRTGGIAKIGFFQTLPYAIVNRPSGLRQRMDTWLAVIISVPGYNSKIILLWDDKARHKLNQTANENRLPTLQDLSQPQRRLLRELRRERISVQQIWYGPDDHSDHIWGYMRHVEMALLQIEHWTNVGLPDVTDFNKMLTEHGYYDLLPRLE